MHFPSIRHYKPGVNENRREENNSYSGDAEIPGEDDSAMIPEHFSMNGDRVKPRGKKKQVLISPRLMERTFWVLGTWWKR